VARSDEEKMIRSACKCQTGGGLTTGKTMGWRLEPERREIIKRLLLWSRLQTGTAPHRCGGAGISQDPSDSHLCQGKMNMTVGPSGEHASRKASERPAQRPARRGPRRVKIEKLQPH
jgi:hypothetical protein